MGERRTGRVGQQGMSNKARKAGQYAKWVTRHADPVRRQEAAQALGKMQFVEYVDALAEAVGDPDADVRVRALEALGRFKLSAVAPHVVASALAAVAGALNDQDAFVRAMSAQALVKLGPCPETHVADLFEAMEDKCFVVVSPAIQAIGKMGPAAAMHSGRLAEAISDDSYRSHRYQLVKALGNMGPKAAAHAGVLMEALQEETKDVDEQHIAVRCAAIEALVQMGPAAVSPHAVDIVRAAQGERCGRARQAFGKLMPLLDKVDEDTVRSICLAFGPEMRTHSRNIPVALWEQALLPWLLVSQSPEKRGSLMRMFRAVADGSEEVQHIVSLQGSKEQGLCR